MPAYCSDEHEPARPVPEFFMKNANAPLCVFEVTFKGTANSKKIFRLIDDAYEQTAHWTRGYTFAGIDYVSFQKFFVISYSHCMDRPFELLLRKDLGTAINVHVSEAAKRTFVGTVRDLTTIASVPEFWARYRPSSNIKDCLVSITSNPDDADAASQELISVWHKYRFPILDISSRNNSFYLLFSNYCKQRLVVYGALLKAARGGGSHLRSLLSPPNGHPDVGDYLSRYGPTP